MQRAVGTLMAMRMATDGMETTTIEILSPVMTIGNKTYSGSTYLFGSQTDRVGKRERRRESEKAGGHITYIGSIHNFLFSENQAAFISELLNY